MTKRAIKKICIWSIILLVIGISAPDFAYAEKIPTFAYTEETANVEAKIVEVYNSVSVLDAPGYENQKLQYNGSTVMLKKGDKVAGMRAYTTDYNELWYEVRWVEDNIEFHGYVYSGFKNDKWVKNYCKMTDDIAENIPTPTPLPTDTPTPTPIPTDTPIPTPTAGPTPIQKLGKSPIPFIFIMGVMVVLAAVAYYYLVVKRKQNNNTNSADQIKRLKNAIDRDAVIEREKKLYENVSGGTKANRKESLGQGVYTVKTTEEKLTNPDDYEDDERLRQIAQSVKEKEIIRRELEALDARDMVYHKYFGEGQVVDNSDVNNVEVKFVNHGIMYIDKEEAARKSLMRKL